MDFMEALLVKKQPRPDETGRMRSKDRIRRKPSLIQLWKERHMEVWSGLNCHSSCLCAYVSQCHLSQEDETIYSLSSPGAWMNNNTFVEYGKYRFYIHFTKIG